MSGLHSVRSYRRLLRYARPYWKRLAHIMWITLLSAGVMLLQPWPMKVLVDQVLSGYAPTGAVAAVLSALPGAAGLSGLLAWVVLSGLLLFAVNSSVDVVLTFAWIRTGQGMVYDLAQDMFARLQRRSVLFHHRHPVGDSLSRVTVDSWCVYTLASSLLVTPVRAGVVLMLTAVVMWRMDPGLTLVALTAAPLMAVASWHFGRSLRSIARLRRDVESRMRSHVQRTLRGLPVVQAFSQEDRERARFEDFADEAIRLHRRGAVRKALYDLGGGVIPILGTAVVLWFGAHQVIRGQLTVGGLLVFVAYLATLSTQMKGLMDLYATLQSTGANVERVIEVLEMVEEVKELPGAKELERARGQLRLEGVSFGYEADQPVLREVSLTVQPGETLAIVGSTGAGKSTLVSLVPRFFDPWAGRVLIDGADVRELKLESLRRQVALVLQEPFLFPITVAENIAYGRPGAAAEEIEAAARAANAHDFIVRLPQGYGTVLGERGATLSGGERQRISIARALLKDAPILILDEPTSALDVETEGRIVEALERLIEGRTTLIIAHRFSTIRKADRIMVLEHGRVVEQGSHDELMADVRGSYRRLYSLQSAEPLAAARALTGDETAPL